MSELGDVFKASKKAGQEKRARNREDSRHILCEADLPFEMRNGGAHLIVRSSWGDVFDFWPGTGKFIESTKSKAFKETGHRRKGRGVRSLVAMLR